ncbi:hypothetical protein FPSE_05427 [Fusarium pseudograminearum CS3096]|uniref:NACHT domain-containing protein n=1 Tax=Fusarium pseudograminearum (strain CS3096) TaxID=1028729 RepID=K3UPU8_FUSPC|nr:hypothetical protein FPSE_05427 [Fusarium pseudograminearum CS3096]EKJ74356.1 hypothetical protein FPSE_05427 [Fusarium pseudograminearum CS3096]KAF0639720.1 hypothetical protein FPSE5266_05427 [Fusarium pseudograminearum]
MTKEAANFTIEGELGALWDQAEKEFLSSETATSHKTMPKAEYTKHPTEWLESFQKDRNKNERLLVACRKVGRHLEIIQAFVKALGFSVQVASAVMPILSPASLVVNAFAWLFGSFAAVKADLDKVETFFERISKRLESLIPLNKHLAGGRAPAVLQKRIVELFVSCLGICSVGERQVKKRLKTWVRKLKGDDEVDPALDKFNEADKALRDCISVSTLDATLTNHDNSHDDLLYRDQLLEWLSSIGHSTLHQRIREQTPHLVIGGRWLLTSELFTTWKEHDVDRIWYTGKPGAGKSVLASTVIEHLRSWVDEDPMRKSNTMVTHLYLSYTSSPDVKDLLGSILRQCQAETNSHPTIVAMFQKYRLQGLISDKVQPPKLDDIKEMLNAINQDKRMFIIIDALDEFEINSRRRLLKSLKEIKSVVKIMVTSRVLNHLKFLQEGFETDTIKANDEDMDRYIESVINSRPSLSPFANYHQRIKEVVKRQSGNMFILVRLHMDALSNVQHKAQLEHVLETLPSDLQNAYKDTMIRIRRQADDSSVRATTTLGWVTFSERLLSVHELQHALAIAEIHDDSPFDYLRQEKEIISECCGLLIVDLDDMVRYVHRSAGEFFDRVKHNEFPEFDAKITVACIKYLSIPALVNRVSAMSPKFRPRTRLPPQDSFPLKGYAGQYLHKHHRRIANIPDNEEVANALYNFVLDDDKRLCYTKVVFRRNSYETRSTLLKGEVSPIDFFDRVYSWSSEPLNALHIAVYLGNSRVVELLINDKVNINMLDPCGQSSLSIALDSGLDFIASILLRNGAEVDLTTERGHGILLHCMEKDYKSVIEQIIGDSTERVPHQELLKILGILCLFFFQSIRGILSAIVTLQIQSALPKLETSNASSLDSKTSDEEQKESLESQTELLRYTYEGNIDCLEAALRNSTTEIKDISDGAGLVYTDTGESDPDDIKPRYYDSSEFGSELDYGSESVSHVSSAEYSDSYHESDPTVPASEVERSLVESSHCSSPSHGYPESEESDAHSESARITRFSTHETSDNNNELERGEDKRSFSDDEVGACEDTPSEVDEIIASPLNDTDKIKVTFLRTACFLAVENGKHEAILSFLNFGVSPNLTNLQGQSLLHRATWRGDYKLVEILIEHGANVDQRDHNGRTPLLGNAGLKRKRVLKLLISHGADINLRQREGCHELYEAAVFGAINAVDFFLEQGVDPSITNNFGWTPLHGAAANGHYEIVKRLIKKGVNMSPLSDTYETPLSLTQNGETHYDHILTGSRHYAEAIMKTRELDTQRKITRRDDIQNLLLAHGALTREGLTEEVGEDEIVRIVSSWPGWKDDSWWDEGRQPPYYRRRG